jgi:hypothetical protein
MMNFYFNIISKFQNLKNLNLSNNQFSIKSLIVFSTVIKKVVLVSRNKEKKI